MAKQNGPFGSNIYAIFSGTNILLYGRKLLSAFLRCSLQLYLILVQNWATYSNGKNVIRRLSRP